MKIRLTALLCIMAGIVSCTKSTTENLYNSQEVKIDEYVNGWLKTNPDTRIVYNKSVVRLILSEGEGSELGKDGTATILYAGYDFSNSAMNAASLFATNDSDVAATSKWDLSDESVFTPYELSLKGDVLEGLRLGMTGVRKGEECVILFSGKYGFGRKTGTIPADASLAYHVKILDIKN